MAGTSDPGIARELVRDQRQGAAPTDPSVRPAEGRAINAAEVVMGLARELNTDRIELPGFPDLVARLLQALGDDNTSAKDVVRLVASEPALSARLLQMANSAAFNKSGREISDLKAAISSLGFNVVRGQATTFAMRQMERQEWLGPIRPALAEIWKTSNGVAARCFAVAKRAPGVRADEAMSTGLFHLIGQLYLIARARQESIDPAEIADWQKALHEWHTTIARTILDHWHIPASVAEAVENQNALLDTDVRELAPLTRILCGAKLHYRLHRPGAAPEPEAEEALARVRIGGQSFEEAFQAAQADMEAVRSAMA